MSVRVDTHCDVCGATGIDLPVTRLWSQEIVPPSPAWAGDDGYRFGTYRFVSEPKAVIDVCPDCAKTVVLTVHGGVLRRAAA